MNRKLAYLVLSVAVLTSISWALAANQANDSAPNSKSTTQKVDKTTSVVTETTNVNKQSGPSGAAGRYEIYKDLLLNDAEYDKTILFFYAPWCSECRAFEEAIQKEGVPAGTQILKVDYDSNQELRKKYGVTLQTTFVRVDKSGAKQKLWVGYGKDKTANAILENTQ